MAKSANLNLKLSLFGLYIIFASYGVNSQVMPPPAHSSSPYYVPPGAQSGNGIPNAPVVKWADRWGAIAVDFGNRIIGTTENSVNKRKAATSAMEKCKKAGGTNCKIELTYHNQCVAMVTGALGYSVVRAETAERAGEVGVNMCSEKEKDCAVFYSACSLPVQMD